MTFNWLDNWVEVLMGFFLVLGLFVGVSLGSALMIYMALLIYGILVGRLFYLRKYKFQFRFWVIVIAFLIGIELGTWRYGLFMVKNLIFIIATVLGYLLTTEGHLS